MNGRPHGRFNDRVWIERQVIAAVNRALAPHQLYGLSEAAIALWRRDVDLGSEDRVRMTRVVEEIARRSKLHVDTSRDVFDDEGVPELSSIERLVAELQELAATFEGALFRL
jgi:hypothetical protein